MCIVWLTPQVARRWTNSRHRNVSSATEGRPIRGQFHKNSHIETVLLKHVKNMCRSMEAELKILCGNGLAFIKSPWQPLSCPCFTSTLKIWETIPSWLRAPRYCILTVYILGNTDYLTIIFGVGLILDCDYTGLNPGDRPYSVLEKRGPQVHTCRLKCDLSSPKRVDYTLTLKKCQPKSRLITKRFTLSKAYFSMPY